MLRYIASASSVKAVTRTAPAARRAFSRTAAVRAKNEEHDAEDGALHAHWPSLARRVVQRKSRLKGEGPQGRTKPSPTEEDMWLNANAYDLDRSMENPERKKQQK